MSVFRPGLRVRFVGPIENPFFAWPVGTTGVITQVWENAAPNVGFGVPAWEWKPDTSPLFPVPTTIARSPQHHLRPILDRPETTTWEKLGFHPNDFLVSEEHETLDVEKTPA